MSFKVVKTFTTTSKNQPFIIRLFRLIILPVSLLVMLLVVTFIVIGAIISTLFSRRKKARKNINEEAVQEAIILRTLIDEEALRVQMEEDAGDADYKKITRLWAAQVSEPDDPPIGRAVTSQEVAGLTGEFITSFIKKSYSGFLVQIVDREKTIRLKKIDTSLYFCKYADRSLTLVEHVGPFFLQADKEDKTKIHGFNNKQKIDLTIREEAD